MDKEIIKHIKMLSKTIDNLGHITTNVLDTTIDLANELSSMKKRLNEVELNYENELSRKEPFVAPVLRVDTPYPRRTNVILRAYNGMRRYFAHS